MSQVDKDREEWGRVKEWPQALGTTPMERCSVCLSLESVSWSGGTLWNFGAGSQKVRWLLLCSLELSGAWGCL